MKARTISIIAMMFVVMLIAVVPASATGVATRTLPTSCVQPGDSFTVSITADGYGDFGSVVETLCNGWTYVDGSATGAFEVVKDGNTVTFVLMGAGPKTITYAVQAPNTLGACCDLSGTLNDEDANSYSVGGPSQVCVCSNSATSASATRTLPTSCVQPGDSFTVSITADGYGDFGSVVETLCNGWTYVDGSATGAFEVVKGGNTVTFVLMGAGPKTITYGIQAPNTPGACCGLSGTLNDEDATSYTVGGATQVCVCSPNGPSATRTLPTSCVQSGGSFTVSITADGYGDFGSVVETLCNGWTYVDGSATGAFEVVKGVNTVTFVLMGAGPKTITYGVQAPNTPGACCGLSGTLNDDDAISYTVGGATQVCVCIPDTNDPPTVEVTTPNGGEVWCSTQIVKASAADTDGTISNVEFQYSPDGGANWVHLNNDGIAPYEFAWDTTTVSSGTNYLVKAIATDNDGATATDNSNGTFVIQNPCPGIPLCEGWNLFSVPGVLGNNTVEYVLEGVDGVEAIQWYNASAQNWSTPTDITPLTAFAINVNTSGVIMNLGYMPSVPPSRQMYEGWNLVGLTGMVQKTAEFTFSLGEIDDNYSKIWGPWDCEVGTYTQHGYNWNIFGVIPGGESPPDIYTGNYMMNPYEGHWIKMTDDAMLEAIG